MTTLDEALGAECPSVVKIDVEGFETEVLRGAPNTLANSKLRCVVMELNGSGVRYDFDETALRDEMLDHGFRRVQLSAVPASIRIQKHKWRNGLREYNLCARFAVCSEKIIQGATLRCSGLENLKC